MQFNNTSIGFNEPACLHTGRVVTKQSRQQHNNREQCYENFTKSMLIKFKAVITVIKLITRKIGGEITSVICNTSFI